MLLEAKRALGVSCWQGKEQNILRTSSDPKRAYNFKCPITVRNDSWDGYHLCFSKQISYLFKDCSIASVLFAWETCIFSCSDYVCCWSNSIVSFHRFRCDSGLGNQHYFWHNIRQVNKRPVFATSLWREPSENEVSIKESKLGDEMRAKESTSWFSEASSSWGQVNRDKVF